MTIVEKQIEAALRTAISAAFTAAGQTVYIRAFLLDDSTATDKETQIRPLVVIHSKPYTVTEGQTQSILRNVRVEVTLLTDHTTDPKRTDFEAYYSTLRPALEDQVTINAAMGDASLQGILMEEGDFPPDEDSKDNEARMNMLTWIRAAS